MLLLSPAFSFDVNPREGAGRQEESADMMNFNKTYYTHPALFVVESKTKVSSTSTAPSEQILTEE